MPLTPTSGIFGTAPLQQSPIAGADRLELCERTALSTPAWPSIAQPAVLVRLPAQECRNVEQIFRFAFRPQAIAHGALPLYGRLVEHGVIRRRQR